MAPRCSSCQGGTMPSAETTTRLVADEDFGYLRLTACSTCRGTLVEPCDSCGLPSDLLDRRPGYEDAALCLGCKRREDGRGSRRCDYPGCSVIAARIEYHEALCGAHYERVLELGRLYDESGAARRESFGPHPLHVTRAA